MSPGATSPPFVRPCPALFMCDPWSSRQGDLLIYKSKLASLEFGVWRAYLLLLLLCIIAFVQSHSARSKRSLNTTVPPTPIEQRFQVLRLHPKNDTQLQFIFELQNSAVEYELNFWKAPRDVGALVDIMVPPTMTEAIPDVLQLHNITYQVIIPDVEQLTKDHQKLSKISDFDSKILRDAAVEEDIDRPGTPYYNFRKYSTYSAMQNYMRELAAYYPSFVRFMHIGYSHENRPIEGLKIGNPPYDNSKRIVYIDGGIHAREWAAPHTVLYFIHQLVSKYKVDPEVTFLVDNLNFYVFPMINPDGYEYSRSSFNPNVRMWRKNRSPQKCRVVKGKQQCCRGVDLNRNFDFHWMETGSSDDPCDETYAGVSAFSEPEAKAVRDFIMPRRNKIDAMLTLHTYSQLWVHSYGHKRLTYPVDVNEISRLGQKASSALKSVYGTSYKVGSGADTLYPASGGSDDWAKAKAGVKYVYLLELRPDENEWDGFILNENELLPTAKETWAGVKVVASEVLSRQGIVQPTPGQSNKPARSSVNPTTIARSRLTTKTNLTCADKRPACTRWVKSNPRLCKTVRYFMREQCALSCQFC